MISLFLISLAYSAQTSIQSSLLHTNHKTTELLQVQGTDTTEEMVCLCLPEDDVVLETEDETPPFESEEECADAFSIVVTCEGDNCTVTDTSDTIDFEVDCDSEDQCLTDINLDVVNSAPEIETDLVIPVFLQQDESDDGSCLEEVHATITCEEGGDCSIIDDSEEFDFEVISNEDGVLDVVVIDSDIEVEECSEEVTVTITCDGESCVVSDDSSTYDLSLDEEDIDTENSDIEIDADAEPVDAECLEDVVVTITCTDGICVATDDSDNYDVSLSDDSGDELVLDVVEVGLEGEDCTEIAQLDVECDGGVCVVDDDTSVADITATVDEVEENVDEDEDDDEEAEEDLDDEEEILEDIDDKDEEAEDDNDFAEESEDVDDNEEAAEDLDDNDEDVEDADDNLSDTIDTEDEVTEDLDDADNEIEDLDDEANENEDANDDEEETEDMDDPLEEIEDLDDNEEAAEDEDDDKEVAEDEDDTEEECEEETDEVHLIIECIDGVDCDVSDDSEEYDFVVTNVGDDQIDIVLLPEGLDESECTETVTVTMSCDGEGCEVESNSDSYDLGIVDNTLLAQEIDAPTFLSLQSN